MTTVGLKALAERAGVSVSTVSRFVAGHTIRPAARVAVEEAMRALEYAPNLAARRLRSQGSDTLGLIVADLANPFFQKFAELVEDRAWSAGRRVIVCNSNEDPAREARYLSLLLEERVAGLMIAPVGGRNAAWARILDALPAVLVDRVPRGAPFAGVTLDNARASAALVEAVYAAGYRRVAAVFRRAPAIGAARRRGFEQAAAALGLPARFLWSDHGREAHELAVARCLERWPDLDAIVAGNSPLMLAAARALAHRHPDVALAGFDTADWLDLLDRPTFWVEQPVAMMAQAALDALLRGPAGSGRRPRRLVFPGLVRTRN